MTSHTSVSWLILTARNVPIKSGKLLPENESQSKRAAPSYAIYNGDEEWTIIQRTFFCNLGFCSELTPLCGTENGSRENLGECIVTF